MNRTHPTTIAQTAANRTYTQKCGRCQAVIEYGVHADWPTVSRLVNEHWATCPSGLNFYGLAPSHPPSQTHDTRNAPSPPRYSIENMGVADDEQFIVGCSKQRKNEGQRIQELENDEYTYDVQPISVGCRGCEKDISLDKRSRYYPGLWTKHKNKCPGIQKIEKDKLARSRGFCLSNRERRPTGTSSFEIDNPRADGISRAAANSVAYKVSGQMELLDEKDLEEGDRDHIPFSTLNLKFYNDRWKRGEGTWTYRYATTKEIMEKTLGYNYCGTDRPHVASMSMGPFVNLRPGN